MKIFLEGQFESLVVALDLAEYLDARQRAAGLRYLESKLKVLR